MTDLAGSLVTSSRPPGRPQKRPDDRTSNASVAVQAADNSRQTTDAGDEQCLRCGCSSPSCTVVLCATDIDGPFHTACTAADIENCEAISYVNLSISFVLFWGLYIIYNLRASCVFVVTRLESEWVLWLVDSAPGRTRTTLAHQVCLILDYNLLAILSVHCWPHTHTHV